MRLLLITFGFPPWGGPAAIRASKICQYGIDQGWDVTVLCADQDCAHVFDDDDVPQPKAQYIRVSDGTDYHVRRHLLSSVGYRGTRLVDRMLGAGLNRWNREAISKTQQHFEQPPDLICSTSPPVEIIQTASELSRHWNVPWIADFRDPPWEQFQNPSELAQIWNRCHSVALNTPMAADYVKQNWPSFSSKVVTSTNAIDTRQITPLRDEPGTHGVIYAGGLYPAVVDTIEKISQVLPVHVYAFREAKRKTQRKILERIPNVYLYDPVRGSEYIRLLREHTAVLIEHPENYRYRIPLKTYSSVCSGRPLLLTGTSDSTRSILGDMHGVFVADPNQPSLFDEKSWETIKRWDASRHWDERERWAKRHTWEVQLANLFSQVS